MATSEEFVNLCKKAIEKYKSGKLSLNAAAAEINSSPFEYPVDEHVHPMLYKVADLAFDIAEDYRSKKEDKSDWDMLIKTLKRYELGDWEPTCWILSAMYGVYDKNNLTHSFSASIKRQNGETIIETASTDIRKVLESIVLNVNAEQTDERYLQNVAKFLPEKIDKLSLTNFNYAEYLTEPYYSTKI